MRREVVADASIEGSETGTSFRQALGFMERSAEAGRHDDLSLDPMPWNGIASFNALYANGFEYTFVLTSGQTKRKNIIARLAGCEYWGAQARAWTQGVWRR